MGWVRGTEGGGGFRVSVLIGVLFGMVSGRVQDHRNRARPVSAGREDARLVRGWRDGEFVLHSGLPPGDAPAILIGGSAA